MENYTDLKDSKLIVFNSNEFGKIRTVIMKDESWLVGKDVATALGYKNTKDAIISHVDKEDRRIIQRSEIATFDNHIPKEVFPVNFVSAEIPSRGLTAINESGLYALIFGSKLPNAKKFKRWVTSEVLPQIRQTGGYIPVNQEDDEKTILAKALLITQNTIKKKDALIYKQTNLLRQQKPKVEFAEQILASDETLSVGEFAKLLSKKGIRIGRNKLHCWLRDEEILMNTTEPYQRYMGWFEVTETPADLGDRIVVGRKLRITPKGQERIFARLKKYLEHNKRID